MSGGDLRGGLEIRKQLIKKYVYHLSHFDLMKCSFK